MDVSGWTVEERMRLPDWCFPERQPFQLYHINNQVGTWSYVMPDYPLPNPACVWKMTLATFPTTGGTGDVKFGLLSDLPLDDNQMETNEPVFDDLKPAPTNVNWIKLYAGVPVTFGYDFRTPIVTTGLKLGMGLYCAVATIRLDLTFIISGLPTKVSGFFNPSTI